MSKTRKPKKKSGNQIDCLASKLNLIAAILNLATVLILLIEKLTEYGRGRETSPPPKDNTNKAYCQIRMAVYVLCTISAALSIAAIVLTLKGRRHHGRSKKKN